MGSSPTRVANYASVAQLVEQGTENPRVVGSIPTGGTTFRGFSSFGRAPPCQGGGGGFEPRNPLQKRLQKRKFLQSFFIQVADLVYHYARACMCLRLDDIQCYALMICRNKLRMIYNGKPLILIHTDRTIICYLYCLTQNVGLQIYHYVIY